jgi:hypothetical protein
MRQIAIILMLFMASTGLNAQTEWKLRKEEDGIRVFTGTVFNSCFKAVRAEFVVKATLSQLVTFLLDIGKQPEWIYNDKFSKLLKRVSENEFIFYSEIAVPWPCTDRDYIAHIVIRQPSPRLMTIDSRAEPDFLPVKPDKIRVQQSNTHWDIMPVGNGQLKIVYTVQLDPGGSVPAWLTNLFVAKGPLQTFQKMRTAVTGAAYKNVRYSFIKE